MFGILRICTEGKAEPDKVFVPVPVPIYCPTPLSMYTVPTPVLVPVPVPVPVPVFIPTTKKSSASILKQIKVVCQFYLFNALQNIFHLINLKHLKRDWVVKS